MNDLYHEGKSLFNRVIDKLQHIGALTLQSFQRLGRGSVFLLVVITSCVSLFTRPALLVKQMYSVGVQPLIIIVVAGLTAS